MKLVEIPLFYRDALISLEDKDFYENGGISYRWLARSMWNNIKAGRVIEWGSTISSQFIRNNLWLNESRSLGRKMLEFIYALRLNHLYSKDEILEKYIGQVYYWYLNYGLASASRYYFSKTPENLTKAEQITLLAIPKDARKFDPYKNPKSFRTRFENIVAYLKLNNILTEKEVKDILNENLTLNYEHDNKLPYIADFMQYGYEKWRLPNILSSWATAKDSLYSSKSQNLSIRDSSIPLRSAQNDMPETMTTTIDYNLTKKIDTLAHNTILDLAWKDVSDYGIIILDRETNELRTMIGWINYHASEWQVSSALALRQPGSAMKPFTYALAFEKFWLTPSDTILDLPVAYKTAEWYEYNPKNYSLDYKGEVTLAEALSQSINVPAIKLADKIWVENLLRFYHQAGIISLKKDADHYGLGITLGNGEVSLYELTRAYSIFANEGRLCDIKVISSKQQAARGKLSSWATAKDPLHSNKVQNSYLRDSSTSLRSAQNDNQEVWSCAQIASTWSISDINLILTNRYFKLAGFPVHSSLDFPDRNVFVKTGTSRNFRDNWAVGFTDHYIIGIWTGNKSGAFMKWVSGATGAWEIFSRIVYALESDTINQLPTKLENKEKQYLEITAPLPKSIFAYDASKSLDSQKIKLSYSTNIEYDSLSWLLDGKNIPTNFIAPIPGKHTIELVLIKDGDIIKRQKQDFEVLEK